MVDEKVLNAYMECLSAMLNVARERGFSVCNICPLGASTSCLCGPAQKYVLKDSTFLESCRLCNSLVCTPKESGGLDTACPCKVLGRDLAKARATALVEKWKERILFKKF